MAGRIASQGKRSQVHPVSIIKEAGSQTSAKENQAVVKSPPLRKAPEAPQSGAVRQPLQGTQLVNKSVAPLLEAPACKVVADKSKGVTGNAKAQGAVAASHLRHMSDDADKVKRESCGPSEDSATGNGLKQRKVLQKGAPPLLPTPVLEAVDPRACLLAGDAEASLEDKGPLQPAGTLTTKAGALSATTGSLPAAGSENAGGEKKNKAARRKEREPWRDPGPKDIVGPQRSRSRSEELKKQSVSAEGAGPKVQNEERVQEGWNEGVAGVAVVDPQRVVVDGAAGASSGTKEKKGSSRGQRRRVEDSPGNREAQQNAAEVLENKPKLESGAVRVEAASKPENPSVEGSGPKVGEGNEAVAWSAVAGESKEESGAERAVSDGAGKEAGGQQEQPSDEEGWMKVKKKNKSSTRRRSDPPPWNSVYRTEVDSYQTPLGRRWIQNPTFFDRRQSLETEGPEPKPSEYPSKPVAKKPSSTAPRETEASKTSGPPDSRASVPPASHLERIESGIQVQKASAVPPNGALLPTPALPKAGVRVTSSPAGAFGRKGLVVEAKKSGLETQSGLDETTVSGNAGNGAAAERGMWQPASQRATSGVLEGERKLSVKGVASGAGKSSARSKGKKGAAEKSETTAEAAAGVDNVPVTPSASQSAEEKQGGTSGYSRPSPAVQAVVVPAVTAGAVPTVAVAAATAVASAAKPNGSKSRLSVSAPPFIPKSMHASKSAAGVDTAKGPVKQAMQSVAAGVNNQSQRAVAPSGDVGALQTRAEAGVPFTGGGPPSPERVVVTPVKKRKPVENAPSKPTASTPIVGVTALGPELAPKGIPQQNSPDAPSAPPSGVLSAPPPAVPDMNSESASSAKLETGTKKVADLVVGTIRVPHVESVSKGVAPSRVALVVKGGPRGAVRVPRAPVPIKETTAVKSAQALAEPTKSEAGSGGDEKSGEAAEKGSVEVGEPGAVAGAKPGASELSGRKGTETIEATLGDSESGSAVRDSASQSPAPTTDASVAKSTEGREESVAVATNLAVAEPPLSDNPSTNPSTNPSPEVLATASGKGGRKSKPRRLSLVARQQAPKNEQPKFAPKAAAEETKVGSSGGLVENELGGNETVPAELAAGSSAKLSKEAGKGAVPLDTKAAKAESEESTDVPGASKGEGLDSRDNKPKPKAGHGSAGAASTGKADKDRNDVRGAGAENPGTSAARPDLRDPPVPSQVEERKGSGGTSDTAELATSLSQEDSTSKVGAGQESRGGSNAGNEGGGEKTGGDDSRGTGTGPSRGGAPESGGGGGGDEGEKKDGSGASSKNDSSVAGAVKKTDASKGEEGKLAGSGREQNPADVSAGGALEGAAKSAEQRAPLRGEEAAAQLSLAEALGGGNEDRGVFKERLWSYLFDNLGLSIDELYFLCELECDEAHMREAMQVLSEAGDDFRELKARVEKQDRFERERRATRGLPVVHRRNRAIAWEVRRTTSTTERAELLAASLDALRFLRTSTVSQPPGRKPSLPRTPPSLLPKTRSTSQAESRRLAALAGDGEATGRSSEATGRSSEATGRSSSAPGKFSRVKTGEKREVGADAKVDPVGKDLGVKAGQSGELGAPTVAKTRVAKPTETDATRAETSGPGNQSRQRKDLSVKSQGSQKPDGEGKEKAAGKKGSVPKKGLADKKELIEEKSGKAIESDRVSDAGSDRASVHSLSRFSDVGSDPMTSAGDVSGRFGLAASLSRVAAWREKRNWVDHLALVSSPRRADGRRAESGRKLDGKAANRTESRAEAEPNGSRNRGDGSGADEWGSEGGVATKERVPGSVPLIPADKRAGSAERAKMLHDKLMSPERRKKTPSETREKVDEKQARAAQVRIDLESERRAKMQRSAERASKVTEWQEIRRSKLSKSMEVRHQQSESRYEAHLAQIVKRAGDEATKVNEIQFINTMTAENKKLSTQQKMQDSEARRQELLRAQVKKREEEAAKEEAAQERRKQKEEERQRKLSEAQRKKEEAAARQEEEKRKLMQERKERALQQAQRMEEQKRAQQEQAEQLGQRLAERLRESSARRLLYLEQIKERAAVDPDRLRLGPDSPYGRLSPNRLSPSRNSPLRRPSSRDGFRSGPRVGGTGRIGGTERNDAAKRVTEAADVGKADTATQQNDKTAEASPPVAGEAAPPAAIEVPSTADKPARPLEKPTIVIPADRASGPASSAPNDTSAAKEALKKRLKRIRQRLVQKKHEWVEGDSGPEKPGGSAVGKSRAAKWLLDMQRQQAKGGNGVALESAAGELVKFFEGRPEELNAARRVGLVDFAASALVSTTPIPPPRAVAALLRVLRVLLTWPGNRSYFIARNFLPPLLPILTASLSRFSGAVAPSDSNPPKASTPGLEKGEAKNAGVEKEGLDAAILEGVLAVAALVVKHNCGGDDKVSAMQEDLVELIVVSEVPQKLRDLFSIFDCPPSDGQLGPLPGAYVASLLLLEGLTSARGKLAGANELPVHQPKAELANSRATKAVLDAVVETGLVGLPSLLTAVLLRAAPPKTTPEQAAAILPANFEEVATLVLRVLNNLARLDLKLFQAQLESSDLKVEFFHLVTFLLSHCTCKWKQPNDKVAGLLHETLLLVGYFALLHPGNQAVLRWGKSPTILQKLCELPFPYFSDSALQPLLFGTLLSACYGSDRNRDVVERELSADMLLGFLQTSAAELPDEVRGAAAASKEKGGERGGASGRALVTGESSVGSLAGDSQSGETSEVQATMQEVKNGAGELSESLANGPGLGTEGKMNFAAKPSSESGAAAEAGTADSEKAGTAGAEVTVEAQREGAETAPDDRKSVRNLQIAEVGRSDTGALKSAVKPSNDGTVKPDATSAADQRTDSVNSKGAAKTGTEPSKPGTDEKSAARLRDSKRESRSRPGSAGARGSKDRGENKLDNRIPSAGIAKRADPTGAKKAGQELAAPFRLQNRFPVSLWTAAEEYFAKPPGKH